MESFALERIELIVFAGAIVALIARRLKIPYTVGLVVAGFLASFLHISLGINFSQELLFKVLLPPLIFEAALYIPWRGLRRDLPLIAVYATVGVLLSTAVTACVMHFVAGWQWQAAALFGILIAATDPVSVIATFKEAGVKGRLRLLVESESLFNDSTAAVGFAVALAFAAGQDFSLMGSLWAMIQSIFGGVLSGLVVGWSAHMMIGRTDDDLVELSLTTVAAFGSFWLAEHFHLSGILATTAAGLLIGNLTPGRKFSEKGEQSVAHFWDFAAFVVNSIIFLLLGITAAYQDMARYFFVILIAVAAVLIGRWIAVYPISAVFDRSRLRVDPKHKHILFWGGLRGALALALALGIPAELPYRQEILTVTFGVVAFSVFVQGLTITALLKKLGQLPEPTGQNENIEPLLDG
jgi:CPA1 family monovalent cation:H+ antiporter